MTSKLKLGRQILVLVALLLPMAAGAGAQQPMAFSGQRAFADIQHLVAFGPRPPGSQALRASRQWIIHQLEEAGCHVEQDAFVGSTPVGAINMVNLVAKIPGASSSVIMLAGHYDTKLFKNFRFVGANDGGSSAAFLLEMARVLGRHRNKYTYWLVFFDGEEALQQWSPTDSLYGSRHLVQKLSTDGDLSRVQAMILVDMIADKNLAIDRDENSTAWLNNLMFKTADRLGYSRYFLKNQLTAIDDDHIPFVQAGVSALDIIDLDYGPNNAYWHSAQDTLAHCSAASLETVGRMVTAMLQELDRSPHVR